MTESTNCDVSDPSSRILTSTSESRTEAYYVRIAMTQVLHLLLGATMARHRQTNGSRMVVFWSGMHFNQTLTAREAAPGVYIVRDPPLCRCVDLSLGKAGSLEAVIISEASCLQEELEGDMSCTLNLEMLPCILLAENSISASMPR